MKKRFILVFGLWAVSFFLWSQHALAASPVAGCELCVIEVQTQGLTDASEEYIVVANLSGQVKSDVTVQYLSAAGSKGSSTKLTLQPGSLGVVISTNLKSANPALVNNWPAGTSSTSGTIQLVYQGAVVDEVGWGSASQKEGPAALAHDKGYSLVRKQLGTGWQDSGNNSDDFSSMAHACNGLSLNEIQPMQLDGDGNDLQPGIELVVPTGSANDQDCPLSINGQSYRVAAGDLAPINGLAIITNVINAQNKVQPIPLLGDSVNALQFVPQSLFGGIMLPGGSLTQPVLLPGQDYSKFGSTWKSTYSLTLGSANQLTTSPLLLTTQPVLNDDCASMVLNELLPNPVGDDTGQEWAELANTSNRPVFLNRCILWVNGVQYSFAADQTIAPGSWLIFREIYDGSTTHTLSLKNTGLSTVSFGRLDSNNTFVPLQTVQYQDAPEGQSWARFEDGWRWLSQPTPGQSNDALVAATQIVPTEFPAPPASTDTSANSQNQNSPASPVTGIMITELLPNPAPPHTDQTDEFIELYNGGVEAVDLSGYKLQAGTNYSYSYTLGDLTLEPDHYVALTSGQTGLALANSAGRARLIGPDGTVISESDAYVDAKDGAAWALIDGAWQWTALPTPGAANIFNTLLTATSSKKVSAKTTKAKTPAKSKTAKAKATKKPKAKKPKKTKKTKTKAVASLSNGSPPVQPLHTTVLVAIAVVALVYGAYEYHSDLANAIYKFRSNRKARRANRSPITGR